MAGLFSVRRVLLWLGSWALVASVAYALPGFVITFEDDLIGAPPRGFVFSWVRQPRSGVWEVRGNLLHRVLVHSADASLLGRSVAASTAAAPRDLRVTTRVRFANGTREGGVVWRYRDGHNGYVAGVSLVRGEAILFRVTAGNRVQLDRLDDLKLDPEAWHTLTVTNHGDDVRVHLDGIAVLHAHDSADEKGGAGVWSAGAAETWFDDLRVEPFPDPPR